MSQAWQAGASAARGVAWTALAHEHVGTTMSAEGMVAQRMHVTTREAVGRDSLAGRLGKAAMDVGMQPDLDATMGAVARNAAGIIGGVAASAALFSSRRWRLDMSAWTTTAVGEADRLQFETKDGPSYTAMHEATVMTVRDTAVEQRWRPWASAACELGLRSMVAVPLGPSPHHWAVMSVYWDLPDQPSRENMVAGVLFAPHAAVAIANAWQSSTLREAVRSRHQIGLAQGILMERLGLDSKQSFDVLLRHSRDHNIKLNRIAEHVVETRSVTAAGEKIDRESGFSDRT
jgi:GAF domain-containing protein